MSKRMLQSGLKMSSIALLALTAGLTACGGGGSGDSGSGGGDSSGGGTPATALPIIDPAAVTACLAQVGQFPGVASDFQTQLTQLASMLQNSAGGGGAAALTTVLSSLLNVNNLFTAGLGNLGTAGGAAGFASSFSGGVASLQCSAQLLSATLSGIAAMGNLPTDFTSSFGPTGVDLTMLLATLQGLMGQAPAGGFDVTALTAQLQSLANDLMSLAPQLPGGSTSPTGILTSALGGNFGDLSQIFGQLGTPSGAGLPVALPTQLSDLMTTLLSATNGSQLGLDPTQLQTLTTTLQTVLGNQQSLLAPLAALLTGTPLGGLLGGLFG